MTLRVVGARLRHDRFSVPRAAGLALSRAAVSAGVAAAVGATSPTRNATPPRSRTRSPGAAGQASRPLLPPRTPGVARTASRRRRWSARAGDGNARARAWKKAVTEETVTKRHGGETFRLSDRMTPFPRLCARARRAHRGVRRRCPSRSSSIGRARRVGNGRRRNREEKREEKRAAVDAHDVFLFPYICASLERPGTRTTSTTPRRPPRVGPRQGALRRRGFQNKKSYLLAGRRLPPSSRDRVCDILWANWEAAVATVKETHLSFDTMLDVERRRLLETRRGVGSARTETAFLEDAAESQKKDVSVKGGTRLSPWPARRLGARRLLALAPDLLPDTLRAMRDDSVCTAAARSSPPSRSRSWRRRWTGTRRLFDVSRVARRRRWVAGASRG